MNQGRPETSAASSLRPLALRARSPGQQCWIGKHAKSTSSPSHTISWQHPAHASIGAMFHKGFSKEPSPGTSLKPCGAAGSFKAADSWPMRRNWPASSHPCRVSRGAVCRTDWRVRGLFTRSVCRTSMRDRRHPGYDRKSPSSRDRVEPAPEYALAPPIVAGWKENRANRDISCFFTFFYDRI